MVKKETNILQLIATIAVQLEFTGIQFGDNLSFEVKKLMLCSNLILGLVFFFKWLFHSTDQNA